jgi:hypothetical protein
MKKRAVELEKSAKRKKPSSTNKNKIKLFFFRREFCGTRSKRYP